MEFLVNNVTQSKCLTMMELVKIVAVQDITKK
jgi:hypothetical protein